MLTSYDLLPEWTFVGGETQTRGFRFKDSNGTYLNLTDGMATLSVVKYMDETQYKTADETPTLVYKTAIAEDNDGNMCLAAFSIPSADTAELYGKFIYQITVRSADGAIGIPFRGHMYIVRNPHPYAITYTSAS